MQIDLVFATCLCLSFSFSNSSIVFQRKFVEFRSNLCMNMPQEMIHQLLIITGLFLSGLIVG